MDKPKLIIIGGGFGGLFAVQRLKKAPMDITLVDRRNFHLFQPLLYQVATGGLSPGDIASPLRSILHRQSNVRVIQGKVVHLDTEQQNVELENGDHLPYDYLIVATGARHHYFGNDQWSERAPGLKSIENALDLRQRILGAYERAERETDLERRRALMRFVIVGAGPTGVELAGALGELAHTTMRRDFRNIDPTQTEILLLEGNKQVLPSFPKELGHKASASLQKLGVNVRTGTLVTDIHEESVTFSESGDRKTINAGTILWAAGVKGSPLGKVLHQQLDAVLDQSGRVVVDENLNIPGHPNIFVIGDLAHFAPDGKNPLPGVAPVAMQMGAYVAKNLNARLEKKHISPFKYVDKGSLAVIGRNAAVAHVGKLRFSGFPAWLLWAGVHIHYLIEFGNKFLVSFQWFWNYITRKRGARLITEGLIDEVSRQERLVGSQRHGEPKSALSAK